MFRHTIFFLITLISEKKLVKMLSYYIYFLLNCGKMKKNLKKYAENITKPTRDRTVKYRARGF